MQSGTKQRSASIRQEARDKLRALRRSRAQARTRQNSPDTHEEVSSKSFSENEFSAEVSSKNHVEDNHLSSGDPFTKNIELSKSEESIDGMELDQEQDSDNEPNGFDRSKGEDVSGSFSESSIEPVGKPHGLTLNFGPEPFESGLKFTQIPVAKGNSEVEADQSETAGEFSDLLSIPGAGPGLVWLLNECQIHSIGDLAQADSITLSSELGLVGTILDITALIEFAKSRID